MILLSGRQVDSILNFLSFLLAEASEQMNFLEWSMLYFGSNEISLNFGQLTHWVRVTHIHVCLGNLTIIGSDNGLSPALCQAIIWTTAGILLIGHSGTNPLGILNGIQTFSFKKLHLNMSSAKCHVFCLGLNVLTKGYHWYCNGLAYRGYNQLWRTYMHHQPWIVK